ncbi:MULTISPECIES: alpha-amylase family glycosyl hydrolase [Aliiglaciecola]|uniref:alpha-amylase family glycosyl hydrolase n=1 Tax=Aliiglaciecola TaxID=1406885 RepID=UPI001C08A0CE|nr:MULTISPECIES: alpha-amylase family glycosyl hydrolase [Aliiglaciecola]MBU2878717.1 hypothetical protein [Aliiglaciecola lipolytica]MDO6711386.1 alpha-amylase family glycosyl hydrolase [Aliiglaciecola sp. 2_MG-2023]MDO6752165.1 alpha-amylase family glycosyl hydrolase [Aliiglaciecola sp. 1_MG-2023]
MTKLSLTLLCLSFCVSCQPNIDVDLAKKDVSVVKKQPLDPSWKNNVIYHVWVRSFFDTNNDGNGDLKGITQKIPYIKSLNVTSILLSPIFASPSNHGYDVIDYKSINFDFGSMEDFDKLLSEAHANGLKIILDIPLNHTSDQHPWFVNSYSKDGSYQDFYRWNGELPEDYGQPWDETSPATSVWHTKKERDGYYYGLFGYASPDLNFKNDEVRQQVKDILHFWINKGVNGFRIDAARHLVEEGSNPLQEDTASNFALISELIGYIKDIDPQVFVIGETFADIETSSQYLKIENGFDAVFNFEFFNGIRDTLSEETLKLESQMQTGSLINQSIQSDYKMLLDFKPKDKQIYTFLNNHDVVRYKGLTVNNDGEEKIIAALSVFSPVNISVYYGEELGISQRNIGEHIYKRGIMLWDKTQNAGFNSGHTPWIDEVTLDWNRSYLPWFEDAVNLDKDKDADSQLQDTNSLLRFYQAALEVKTNDTVMSAVESVSIEDDSARAIYLRYENKTEFRLLLANPYPNHVVEIEMGTHTGKYGLELISGQEIQIPQTIKLNHGDVMLLDIAR